MASPTSSWSAVIVLLNAQIHARPATKIHTPAEGQAAVAQNIVMQTPVRVSDSGIRWWRGYQVGQRPSVRPPSTAPAPNSPSSRP
jgi:hypothetical protein